MGLAKPITIDTTGFQSKVKELSLAVPKRAKAVIESQMKLLIEELVVRSSPKSAPQMKAKIVGNVKRVSIGTPEGSGEIPLSQFYGVWRKGLKIKRSERVKVQKATINAFVKRQMEHRGYLAAGWIAQGNPLQARRGVSSTVNRHPGRGTFKKIDAIGRFRITITNLVSYAQNNPLLARIMAAAISTRKAKIVALLDRVKKGQKVNL